MRRNWKRKKNIVALFSLVYLLLSCVRCVYNTHRANNLYNRNSMCAVNDLLLFSSRHCTWTRHFFVTLYTCVCCVHGYIQHLCDSDNFFPFICSSHSFDGCFFIRLLFSVYVFICIKHSNITFYANSLKFK